MSPSADQTNKVLPYSMPFPDENDFLAIRPSDSVASRDGVLSGLWRLVTHPAVSGAGALATAQYLGAGAGLVTSVVAARPSSFYYASGQVGRFARGFGAHTAAVLGLSWNSIERLGFSGMAGLVAAGKVGFPLIMAGLALITLRREQTSSEG